MVPNSKKSTTKLFFDFGFFWPFFNQKNSQNCQKMKKIGKNPNRLMKFSEIWYLDAFQQRKCYKKTFFGFWPFLAVFNQKTEKKKKMPKPKPFDEIF